MKSSFINWKTVTLGIVLLGAIGAGVHYTYSNHYTCSNYYTCSNQRSKIKEALCAESPALCHCYKNIVDYRLSDKDVWLLSLIQNEIKERQSVNPLEFAEIRDIQHLRILLSICQPQQIQHRTAPQQVQPVTQPQVESKSTPKK